MQFSAGRGAAALQQGRPSRVLVIEWVEPLMITGNWMPEPVQIARGEYGLAVAGAHSQYVTWPSIVNFAPELIIVAPCGFGLPRHKRASWGALPAVQRNQVQVVDGDACFNRPGAAAGRQLGADVSRD